MLPLGMMSYGGPLRGEPLPIALHNTIWAERGEIVDGFAEPDGARAWAEAIGLRAEAAGELPALRDAVRDALQAAAAGRAVPLAAREALNAASARNPRSSELLADGSIALSDRGATATDVVVGTLAAETIALLARPDDLRVCGAPGCVLMFLKDHPRREWCSSACGNRARQARHYARTRVASSAAGTSAGPTRQR